MKNILSTTVVAFSAFLLCCEENKVAKNTADTVGIQSVFIKIVANSTFLKATKESSSSLALGTGKCTLYGGSTILINNWPKDDGNRTLVELRNPIAGCKITKGYIFIPHIAAQNQGWFKTPPPTNPSQVAASADDELFEERVEERVSALSGKRFVCNTPGGLHVRKEPNSSATSLGLLPFAQEITLTGASRPGWVAVAALNINGWVSSEFLCTQKPTATSPSANSGKFSPNCSSQSITFKLPVRSEGLETYGYDELVYGTCRTVERLKELGRRMKAKTGLPIYVGDISAYGGGNLGRHATHAYGDDIDLAVMGNTVSTECYTYTSSCYNRNASRMLIKEIIDMGGLSGICFNDPAIINEFPNYVRYCSGHNDHYHIEWHG